MSRASAVAQLRVIRLSVVVRPLGVLVFVSVGACALAHSCLGGRIACRVCIAWFFKLRLATVLCERQTWP